MTAKHTGRNDEQNQQSNTDVQVILFEYKTDGRKYYPYNGCGNKQNNTCLYNGPAPESNDAVKYAPGIMHKIRNAFKRMIISNNLAVSVKIYDASDENNAHRQQHTKT